MIGLTLSYDLRTDDLIFSNDRARGHVFVSAILSLWATTVPRKAQAARPSAAIGANRNDCTAAFWHSRQLFGPLAEDASAGRHEWMTACK